jgi:hypothetical protein
MRFSAPAGLLDRSLDAVTCTVVAGVGQRRQVEFSGRPVQRGGYTLLLGRGQIMQVTR